MKEQMDLNEARTLCETFASDSFKPIANRLCDELEAAREEIERLKSELAEIKKPLVRISW